MVHIEWNKGWLSGLDFDGTVEYSNVVTIQVLKNNSFCIENVSCLLENYIL